MSAAVPASRTHQGARHRPGPKHTSERARWCRSGDRASPQVSGREYAHRVGGSRFLETDPIEGGSANDYDYVEGDPINGLDLDGQMNVKGGGGSWWSSGKCPASVRRAGHCFFNPTRTQQIARKQRAQRAAAFIGRGISRSNSTPLAKPRPRCNALQNFIASVLSNGAGPNRIWPAGKYMSPSIPPQRSPSIYSYLCAPALIAEPVMV
jgi:hypothetical protein